MLPGSSAEPVVPGRQASPAFAPVEAAFNLVAFRVLHWARLPSRRPNLGRHRIRNCPPAQHRTGQLMRKPVTGNTRTQLRDIA
jgi:hypothetical protein